MAAYRWSDLARPLNLTAQHLVSVAVGLLCLGGCGPRSDRLEVTGVVTLDGAPLDNGAIRLSSIGAEKISASGAMIKHGEFEIPASKGLAPGTYHVEINSPNENAPPVISRETPGGPGIPIQPDRIPPEYNINSSKTVEVTADGDNHFQFDIVSAPQRPTAR